MYIYSYTYAYGLLYATCNMKPPHPSMVSAHSGKAPGTTGAGPQIERCTCIFINTHTHREGERGREQYHTHTHIGWTRIPIDPRNVFIFVSAAL